MSSYIERRNAQAMTVQQVIDKLSALPPDLKVWANGCDCTNPVTEILAGQETVVIEVGL